MAGPRTLAERITALETRFDNIEATQATISKQLEDLLALRNKGVGAFWLASSLLGTGIVGVIYQLLTWWKHP